MSESYGTVVMPNFNGLSKSKIKNIPNEYDVFVETMFDYGGFNKKAIAGNGYVIEKALLRGSYIELSTFGAEWESFANSAMNDDRNLELYGSFSNDYGTHLFFACNENGESFKYSYEDDSDEFEQDYFDEKEYNSRLKAYKEKWLAVAPKVIRNNFASVIPSDPEEFEEDE